MKMTNIPLWLYGLLILCSCFNGQNPAIAQITSHPSSNQWQVNHSLQGETRFTFTHDGKNHQYQVKLMGIKIDGQHLDLPDPVITVHKNRVIKQWLPYVKEIWIDAMSYYNWSFEITDSAIFDEVKQVTLTYETITDGQGALRIDDSGSIHFGTDDPFQAEVSLSYIGTRCHHARNLISTSNGQHAITFDLRKTHFPLLANGHLIKYSTHVNEDQNERADWGFALFSENNDVLQLVVPLEKQANLYQSTKSLDIFHLHNDHAMPNKTILQKVDQQALFNYIHLADHWHPIVISQTPQPLQQPVNSLENWQQALSTVQPLVVNPMFGKPLVLDGNHLYVQTHDSKNNIIQIFENQGDLWTQRSPIVIAKWGKKPNPHGVYRSIETLVIEDDVMLIGLTQTSYKLAQTPKGELSSFNPRHRKLKKSLGVIEVYRRVNDQWIFEQSLTPRIGDSEDAFGEVLAVNSHRVVASAADYAPKSPESLEGLVHVFEYHKGRWKKPVVIKPPNGAQSHGYLFGQGFGSKLAITGDDLYIKADLQGHSAVFNEPNPITCPYFDSYGVIYHYRKIKKQWRLINTIKNQQAGSYITGPIHANTSGLYYLSEAYTASQTEVRIHQYRDGQVIWQEKL